MRKSLFFILFAICLVLSCRNENLRPIPPKNLINSSKMAEILADIHIAEASLNINSKHIDSLTQYTTDYYYAVFKKHMVDRDNFESSMKYYIENPEKLEKIYESVNEILNTKRGKKWQ
jgi:hypothetical protein